MITSMQPAHLLGGDGGGRGGGDGGATVAAIECGRCVVLVSSS